MSLDDIIGELVDQPPWYQDAVCSQVDPALFFPEKGEGSHARAAKVICSGCDVKAQCLRAALERNERFGVWGGLTERERRRLKPTQPAAPCSTTAEMDEGLRLMGEGMTASQAARGSGANRRMLSRTWHDHHPEAA